VNRPLRGRAKGAPLRTHPDIQVIAERRAWSGRFPLDVVRFRHRRFDGGWSPERTWELWRRGHAAALLPYDPDRDAVVLIDQFRLPCLAAGLDPVSTETAAGLVDEGEDEQAAVLREAEEEMGLTADRLERIGTFILTPGGCDETIGIWVGRVTAPESETFHGLEEEAEDIRVRTIPAAQAIADAREGRIANATTAIALLWFALEHARLRAAWRT
jgi:ADP-ribose pyrophosphatase